MSSQEWCEPNGEEYCCFTRAHTALDGPRDFQSSLIGHHVRQLPLLNVPTSGCELYAHMMSVTNTSFTPRQTLGSKYESLEDLPSSCICAEA